MLSGYRIMWLMVMFDLPTFTDKNKKDSRLFRSFLLDNGFNMLQFSVYEKCCGSHDKIKAMIKKIEQNTPSDGIINIFSFTDKQFGSSKKIFNSISSKKHKGNTNQLMIF